MKIHLGSFLIGVIVGATGVTVAKRLRPVGVELLALGYKLVDAVETRLAMGREALEDALAEAKTRARGLTGAPAAPSEGEERAAA